MKWKNQIKVLVTKARANNERTIPIALSIITEFERKLSIKGVPASTAATNTYQVVSMIPANIAINNRSN